MVLAMASFVVNDSLVKSIGRSLPVGELIAIRGALSIAFLAAIAAWSGVLRDIWQAAAPPVLIRALLDMAGTLAFVTALMHMPIANLTAITQSVPLAVTLLSVVFLGERVGIRRTAAIMAGFLGVLLIVRPAPSTFTLYDGLAFLIVFAVAARDVMTKRIPAHVPIFVVALANAVFVTLGGLLAGLAEGFVRPGLWQIATLAAAAIFLASGYLLMVATLRLGDLSGTAPFRYSVLVFAILSGVFVFGEVPDLWASLGMVLIVAAGLYAAHREWLLSHNARTPAP